MAYDKNHFELIGRVADVKKFGEVTKVRIAANLPSRDGNGERTRRAYFNNVTVFRPATRSYIDKYVAVGDLVGCAGHIQEGSYEKEGETHYTTDLVAGQVGIVAKTHRPTAPARATNRLRTAAARPDQPPAALAPSPVRGLFLCPGMVSGAREPHALECPLAILMPWPVGENAARAGGETADKRQSH